MENTIYEKYYSLQEIEQILINTIKNSFIGFEYNEEITKKELIYKTILNVKQEIIRIIQNKISELSSKR